MSSYWSHLQLPSHIMSHVDKNLRSLYVVRVLRDVINQITLFFVPIYLFELSGQLFTFAGMSAAHFNPLQRTLLLMAVFYAIERLVITLTAIPLGSLTKKIGFSRAFFFSYLLRLCGFVGLLFVPQYPLLLVVVAGIEGVQSNLFWPGFFTLFCQHSDGKRLGSTLGLLQFFLQLAGSIAPALGGFLAYRFGFTSLFLFAAVLQLVSLSIIGLLQVDRNHDAVSWKEFVRWMRRPNFIRDGISYAGRYFNDAVTLIWPLYIYLIVGGVDRVGYLFTVSLILALVCVVAVGVYLDRAKSSFSFYLSGTGLAVLWIVRSLFAFPWLIAAIQTTEKILGSVYWMIYDVSLIRMSKGNQAFSQFVYRELVMSAAGVVLWITAAATFMVVTEWHVLFIAAAVGVGLSLLIQKGRG